MRSLSLRRFRKRAATCAGFSSPGCAAPSAFFRPSTRCSARDLPGPVSCRSHPWDSAFRGFPSPVASLASRRGLPLLPFASRHPPRPKSEPALETEASGVRASGESVLASRCGFPWRDGRSSPGLHLFEVFSPRSSTPCFHDVSSPGLRHDADSKPERAACRHICSSESQRTEGWLASFESRLPP